MGTPSCNENGFMDIFLNRVWLNEEWFWGLYAALHELFSLFEWKPIWQLFNPNFCEFFDFIEYQCIWNFRMNRFCRHSTRISSHYSVLKKTYLTFLVKKIANYSKKYSRDLNYFFQKSILFLLELNQLFISNKLYFQQDAKNKIDRKLTVKWKVRRLKKNNIISALREFPMNL